MTHNSEIIAYKAINNIGWNRIFSKDIVYFLQVPEIYVFRTFIKPNETFTFQSFDLESNPGAGQALTLISELRGYINNRILLPGANFPQNIRDLNQSAGGPDNELTMDRGSSGDPDAKALQFVMGQYQPIDQNLGFKALIKSRNLVCNVFFQILNNKILNINPNNYY